MVMFAISLLLGTISGITIITQSIRLDESQSIWAASHTLEGVLRYVALDVHMPLYPVLLHFWLTVFDYGIEAARAMSLVFLLLSLVVMWILLSENVGRKLMLISFVLVSFSPFLIWYGNEARMYTLFLLFTLINVLFYLRIIGQTRGWKKWGWGLFLASVLGVYTHYFFWLLLAVETVYGGWKWLKMETERGWIRRWGLMLMGIVGSVAPWVVFAISQGLFENMAPSLTQPDLYSLMTGLVNYLIGYQASEVTGVFLSLWPVGVLGIMLFLTTRIKTKVKHVGFWVMWAIAPWIITFLVSFWRPVFLPRYLIFTLPSIMVLVGWVVVEVFNYREKGWGLILIALVMVGLFWQESQPKTSPVVEDYRTAAAWLNSEVGLHDKVIVSSPFTIIPLEYQFKKPNRMDTVPRWNRYFPGPIPSYDPEEFENQIENYKQIYTRLFVVLSYDQGYEAEIKDYLDHNLERLKIRNITPKMKLLVYRLRYDVELPQEEGEFFTKASGVL